MDNNQRKYRVGRTPGLGDCCYGVFFTRPTVAGWPGDPLISGYTEEYATRHAHQLEMEEERNNVRDAIDEAVSDEEAALLRRRLCCLMHGEH